MPEEKVVMYESPEAASIQTVTGWVSADGRFWGNNEDVARYSGSTHRLCKNNPDHPAHPTNRWCGVCRNERLAAQFAAIPRRIWGGEPITDFDGDRYFFDEEDLRDYILDHDIDLADLKLVFWADAREAARVKAEVEKKPDLANRIAQFQFRDIRPKAASEINDLSDASVLLGHSKEGITERVYRRVGAIAKPSK